MIDWIFLDVGNVLLDEDPLTFLSFRRHAEAVRAVRPDRGFADLLAEREARALAGSRWPVFDVISSYLDEARCAEVWEATACEVRARFHELSPIIPGAAEVVDRLARRFRLGLIANQPRECRGRLASLGILERFDVVALAEEEGTFKPDLDLFRLALDRAGATASASLMVGDRLDDDLAPASALGMATVWVRWPDRGAKGWRPDDPDGLAYRRSLERTATSLAARWDRPRPWRTIDTLSDIDATLGDGAVWGAIW